MPFFAWFLWGRAALCCWLGWRFLPGVSCLAFVVARRAVLLAGVAFLAWLLQWRAAPCCRCVLGRVGASYSLSSPNRPPPSPAHPAIPARLAALRVGAGTEMRVPVFRCRRTRDRTGKGWAVPTISARSVRRTAHPLNGRGAKSRPPNPDSQTARQTNRLPGSHVRRITPAVVKMRIAGGETSHWHLAQPQQAHDCYQKAEQKKVSCLRFLILGFLPM